MNLSNDSLSEDFFLILIFKSIFKKMSIFDFFLGLGSCLFWLMRFILFYLLRIERAYLCQTHGSQLSNKTAFWWIAKIMGQLIESPYLALAVHLNQTMSENNSIDCVGANAFSFFVCVLSQSRCANTNTFVCKEKCGKWE